MTRFYVESYADMLCRQPILGNLDGQASLLPEDVEDYWHMIVFGPRYRWSDVKMFRLVTAGGRVLKAWRNEFTPTLGKCTGCHRIGFSHLPDNDLCDECAEHVAQEEAKHLQPLYEAELRAGLTLTDEEYRTQMKEAGRGGQLK